jgi:hypothetical protein
VAGIKSEWWPGSDWNGGRHQIGISGRLGSESAREVLRRRISSWISEGEHAVIVGDAGFGKSTVLRVFALDLLATGVRFPALTLRWGDRIPILIPFAFWVRLVEQGEVNISLREAMTTWFSKFDVSDGLLSLI